MKILASSLSQAGPSNNRRTTADTERSIQLYQEAVNTRPDSALSGTVLAQQQSTHAHFTGDLKYLSAAETCASRAIQLNPSAAESHKAASMVV